MGDCVVGGELMKVQGWGWFFFWEIAFVRWKTAKKSIKLKYALMRAREQAVPVSFWGLPLYGSNVNSVIRRRRRKGGGGRLCGGDKKNKAVLADSLVE